MLSICHLSIAPVRKEASDKSEQVTQLLFGELVETVEIVGSWANIRTLEEGYPGYVDAKQLAPLSDEEALSVQTTWNRVVDTPYLDVVVNGIPRLLVAGSRIPGKGPSGTTSLGTLQVPDTGITPFQPSAEAITKYAHMYLGAPYLWGGKSPFGIDCSGFTQLVFRLNGISLPRDAWQQATTGMKLESGEEPRTGDLAFFKNQEGKIVHVGIILGHGRIIHASGEVRIDTLDTQGIQHNTTNKNTHQLDSIRRYF